jgi:dTDP-4-amino-4,6-dideoxygalactose transaminase
MIVDGFVVNPDQYLIPDYKISPFRSIDIGINRDLSFSDQSDRYFQKRFLGKNIFYTENGRQAIHLTLSQFHLGKNDCVTIFTTSNNFYISSCVTKEIEKFCLWSRKIENNTKILFVNHEFGFPYENLRLLKEQYHIPIIEDCAHAFYSDNAEHSVGKVGDFVIFSFPKFFRIQVGGILVADQKYHIKESIDAQSKTYIQKVISHYIDDIDAISEKRKQHYRYLKNKIKLLRLETRFDLAENTTPGVFMFKVPEDWNTVELKKYFWRQGVESSVFYNESAYFLPVHQELSMNDLDYLITILTQFNK